MPTFQYTRHGTRLTANVDALDAEEARTIILGFWLSLDEADQAEFIEELRGHQRPDYTTPAIASSLATVIRSGTTRLNQALDPSYAQPATPTRIERQIALLRQQREPEAHQLADLLSACRRVFDEVAGIQEAVALLGARHRAEAYAKATHDTAIGTILLPVIIELSGGLDTFTQDLAASAAEYPPEHATGPITGWQTGQRVRVKDDAFTGWDPPADEDELALRGQEGELGELSDVFDDYELWQVELGDETPYISSKDLEPIPNRLTIAE